jgi:hypothetical protein
VGEVRIAGSAQPSKITKKTAERQPAFSLLRLLFLLYEEKEEEL